MFGKNKATPQVESAISKAVNFELTIADMARRSERRAWLVAWTAIVMALILAGGYFYMLPLKEKVPYLVMADAYTGTSSIARLQGDFGNNSITASEAINRSNVAHFVIARESYDIALMNLRDWTTVYTMSHPSVASGYTALHSPNNPESPYKTYGNARAIRVRILSIVLIGGGNGIAPKGATVRFQRSVYDKATGVARPLDSKLATLEFTYASNLKMSEKERIENPLGFRVTSYRVDSDYAASPPVDAETSAPTSTEMQQVPSTVPSAFPQPDGMPPATAPGAPAVAPTMQQPALQQPTMQQQPGLQQPTMQQPGMPATQQPAPQTQQFAPQQQGVPTAAPPQR